MAGCLDSIHWSRPDWLDFGEKRNAVASITAGVLFFTGWWLIIDVAARYTGTSDFNNAYQVCGIFGTCSLFMINAVSTGQMQGEGFTSGFLGQRGSRIWLFVGFVLGFSSIIAATWILFAAYIMDHNQQLIYPGFALFLQNLFIISGSLVYKFGRTEDLWS